jgi:beta-glucanase (GH16 family)
MPLLPDIRGLRSRVPQYQSRARATAAGAIGRSPFELGATVAIVLAVLVPLFIVNLLASGSAHSAQQVVTARADPGPAPTTTSSFPPSAVLPPTDVPQSVTPSHAAGPLVTGPAHNPTPTTTTNPTTPTTTVPVPALVPAVAPAPPAGCSGDAPLKSDGTPWTCTFDDEFNGTSLDAKNWIPQQTATSGYHSGAECFEDSPNNVSVSGGTLNLTVRQEASSSLCPGLPLPYFTPYSSGMVSTYQRFSQTYGLFEVRAKLPAAAVQGLQETFWLWPVNANRYGSVFPDSGEIDFAEFYSQYANTDIPYIHYNDSALDSNVTSDTCVAPSAGQFHTYGVEWSPTTLTIFMDGQTCLVDQWHPLFPESGNEPFNQPFIISLTQALGIETNQFEPGQTPLPATTQVDWVRVWS